MNYKNPGDIPVSELEHHGIKGMKWGVRRSEAQLARAAGKKPRTAQEIKDARKRHNKQMDEVNKNLNRVSYSGSKAEKLRNLDALKRLAAEARDSPDITIGARMTRGEAVVSLLAGGPIGPALQSASNKAFARHTQDVLDKYSQLTLDDFYDNSRKKG